MFWGTALGEYPANEFVGRKRLRKNFELVAVCSSLGQKIGGYGISRHENDPGPGGQRAYLDCRVDAAHFSHHNVGNHPVRLLGRSDGHGFFPAMGDKDPGPALFEYEADRLSNEPFVVNYQHTWHIELGRFHGVTSLLKLIDQMTFKLEHQFLSFNGESMNSS